MKTLLRHGALALKLPNSLLTATLLAGVTATLFVPRDVRAEELVNINLSDEYAQRVLNIYTGMGYVATNIFLRNTVEFSDKGLEVRYAPLQGIDRLHALTQNKSKTEIAKLENEAIADYVRTRKLVRHLELAIRKYPAFTGEVFRGVRHDDMFTDYKVGDHFMDRAFVSTSKDVAIGQRFRVSPNVDAEARARMTDDDKGPLIVIHAIGERGHDISPVNGFESEVLFDRDTIFKIDAIERTPNGKIRKVVMTEQTFASPKDYRNARLPIMKRENLRVLGESYPRHDGQGDVATVFKSTAFKTWNKADRDLAKLIHAFETKNQPYDRQDLNESDFEFEE